MIGILKVIVNLFNEEGKPKFTNNSNTYITWFCTVKASLPRHRVSKPRHNRQEYYSYHTTATRVERKYRIA